jgi:hypothetical protein
LSAYDDVKENEADILKDELTLNRFKEQAYQVAKEFDITKILPMYESIYEKAFAKSILEKI